MFDENLLHYDQNSLLKDFKNVRGALNKSLPLKISLVNVSKSTGSSGFGRIY